MSQLSYAIDPTRALEGQIADSTLFRDIVSRLAQADIPFGRFVTRHTAGDDDQVRLPALTGEVTATGVGFAIVDVSIEAATVGGGDGTWEAEDSVPVMRRGRIVLVPEDDVTAGDPVFVRFTAGGAGETPGRVRSDIDGGDAVQLPGAFFVEDALAGELCVVDVNL
jgi:hypothetical protein